MSIGSEWKDIAGGLGLSAFVASALVACGGRAPTFPFDGGSSDATAAAPDGGAASTLARGALVAHAFGTDGGCLALGGACLGAGDCCSGDCRGGACQFPACQSDGQTCAADADCCSQTCRGGVCATLNDSCKTLGNACGTSADCCSHLCVGGTCQASSFCGQPGDSCASATDCCTGACAQASGQSLGTCATSAPGGPANCGLVDGQLCAEGGNVVAPADAGLPACGGPCCSRACAPWGPTGVLVCQPASGCHVVGDLCTQDADCCGSAGLPGGSGMPVTCVINAGAAVGVCRNPMGCKPDGDVCKLKTSSCNSSCDCCSGNCETEDTCHQDNLGVPRCAPAQCVPSGGACASSASCCGTAPCVPNRVAGATPQFVCAPTACVAACGACTQSGDCCPGTSCVVAPGSTRGACGPCGSNPAPPPNGSAGGDAGLPDSGISAADGGNPSSPPPACALLGQLCQTSADCCGGITCSGGRCQSLL